MRRGTPAAGGSVETGGPVPTLAFGNAANAYVAAGIEAGLPGVSCRSAVQCARHFALSASTATWTQSSHVSPAGIVIAWAIAFRSSWHAVLATASCPSA